VDLKESEVVMIYDQVKFISRGSVVRRFHQHPQLVDDTDGRHSHGVACLAALLCEGAPSANLLMAALFHDLGEQIAGDVPAPTKRHIRATFDLDLYEAHILRVKGFEVTLEEAELRTLKLADALDGMLSCARERAMGNRTVHWVYTKWLLWLSTDFGALSSTELEAVNAVKSIYQESWSRPDAGWDDKTDWEQS
jgi:5'-deoxynucleotidase YfbR-like HD superfamily hydrolase